MQLLGLMFLAGFFFDGHAEATPPISLQKPITCEIGKDCFIQNYPDRDQSFGEADYRCGGATYDGATATNIRLPDHIAVARGVAVVAAAQGIVVAVRDGVQDFGPGTYDRKKVGALECGNGVVLQHADGWETEYCGLRNGSVKVKEGDTVTAGAFLGYVGQSGNNQVPMLGFVVRYKNGVVDPFAYRLKSCSLQSVPSSTLWRQEDQAALVYRETSLVNSGVTASAEVTMTDIDRGVFQVPDSKSAAVLVYVRAIHLKRGDEAELTVQRPDGAPFAKVSSGILDRNKAQYMLYAGQKLKSGEWPAGEYRATYRLLRDGADIYESQFTFVVASSDASATPSQADSALPGNIPRTPGSSD